MKNPFSTLINIILPPRCINCGTLLSEKNGLCSECFNNIHFISEPLCNRCGCPLPTAQIGQKMLCAECLQKKKPLITMKRAAFIYDDSSKKLILDFKFYDKTSSAEAIAQIMHGAGRDIWSLTPNVLIPVPLHRLRLLKRRYNQSALLAHHLSKLTGIPTDCTSLIRQENTIPQVLLNQQQRMHNLKHAFAVKNPQKIAGKSVVLIDDVSTTGSTLEECARTLKKAGAAKIYALTAGHTEL